jgi:hypothetical protein
MDLQNDIKEINNRVSSDVNDIINQAEQYNQIMKKKSHILSVLNTIKLIEELQQKNFFQESRIWYIDFNTSMQINFFGINKNYISSDFRGTELDNLFKNILTNNTLYEYTNKDYSELIDLNKPVKEQVLKVLLSPELQKLVEYNEMQMELPHNDLTETKKLKL